MLRKDKTMRKEKDERADQSILHDNFSSPVFVGVQCVVGE